MVCNNILTSTIYKTHGAGNPMVVIYPFPAVRPAVSMAQSIAAVPYDVVTTEEARACIERNPLTFLRVSRADADMPMVSPNDPRVYERARERFMDLVARGHLVQDDEPSLYLYRVYSGHQMFTGLVACAGVGDYHSGLIRRHELTQYEKEEDRTRHIDTVNAQTGLVFLVYRDRNGLHSSVESLLGKATMECEVASNNGSRHQVLRVSDPVLIAEVKEKFLIVDALYIADGHHRAAAAANVALKRELSGHLGPESGRIMAVLFAHHQVMIHGYSRLITDLRELTQEEFLAQVATDFTIEPCDGMGTEQESPIGRIFMYLPGQWYCITLRDDFPSLSSGSLDVTVLQERILERILGIGDPRRDPRLHYRGGIHSPSDLEEMVNRGTYAVAFAMVPVNIETVMEIADAKGIMPPKSTWFEPKLLSGLLVHLLD